MSIYVVIHMHKYGCTSYLVSSEALPTERQVVRELGINFEPSRSESLTIADISDEEYRNPKVLNHQEGDDEEFDEYDDDEEFDGFGGGTQSDV